MIDMSANTTKILAEFALKAELNDLLTELITPVIADCFGCIIAVSNSEVAIRTYKSFEKIGYWNNLFKQHNDIIVHAKSTEDILKAKLNNKVPRIWFSTSG